MRKDGVPVRVPEGQHWGGQLRPETLSSTTIRSQRFAASFGIRGLLRRLSRRLAFHLPKVRIENHVKNHDGPLLKLVFLEVTKGSGR